MRRGEVFRDARGGLHPYDGESPVSWRASAYGVACRDGRVLMVEPAFLPGRWDLPGGGVEPGERLPEGVVREVWEETGHVFEPGTAPVLFLGEAFFHLPPALEPAPSAFRHSLLFAVRGTARPGEGWIPDARETRRVAWVDPATLAPGAAHPVTWRALQGCGLVPPG
jgi:8-oxo-dGTP pyrophosphatase MutT (NUDIX family)